MSESLISDFDVAQAMVSYGGNFMQAIGVAWKRADQINANRLQAAFAEEWAAYRDLVALKRKRDREQASA